MTYSFDMKRCHRCGREWAAEKKQPGVKDFCDGCSAYLHCCLNCRHYDPAKHNQCAIGTTEWVGDKAGANFCDEFEFRDAGAAQADAGESEKARNAIETLLGPSAARAEADRLDRFKGLLGD